jgi:cbb3-type cytochrome oxidase subunit 3
MHKELLTHSPLLALPLAALLLFFFVFVAVVLRTMTKRAHDYAPQAALPLQDDTQDDTQEPRHGRQ